MERRIYQKLVEWKNKKDRKPLILNGARQVGKTYILQEFARNEYAAMAYFSLDREDSVRNIFNDIHRPEELLLALSAVRGVDIKPGHTILVLDEIQECPPALTALKFFCEDIPHLHIAVAGSLLGLSLHGEVSFPVGKVDMLNIYPMSFEEFLLAMDRESMARLLESRNCSVADSMAEEYISLLRQYYFVGGMPEAVKAYAETHELRLVRSIQQTILQNYRRDFSKHAPLREVPRINMVWDSIPSQLAKENKKFVYGAIRKGARASDYEMAIEWLVDAGLVYKVSRVSKAEMPLKFYEEREVFKLFMLDVGLFGAMADAPASAILVGTDIFKEYKGAFTELYVHNALLQAGRKIYYYSTPKSTLEIDFILQNGGDICPIEVKAEENVKSKSLRTFVMAHPSLKGYRISMKGHADQGWMQNLPLYNFLTAFTSDYSDSPES